MASQVERIASLEIKVNDLATSINSMENKLDDLLALKNKGAGVFWLFSTIMGTGILGLGVQILDWFKHSG